MKIFKNYFFYFLLSLLFPFFNAKGQNNSGVIQLPSGNFSSDYFFDSTSNEMWFSFIADKDRMTFSLMHSTTYSKAQNITIDSLLLLNSNGSFISYSKSLNENSDTLPAIQLLNLVKGNTYYLKVTKYTPGGSGHFNFSKIVLEPAIIPPACVLYPCLVGPNLICNGDFEIIPSWSTGNCYADSSPTFPNSPPLSAAVGYCISTPNVRNDNCSFFANPNNCTDLYVIGNTMGGGNFQNVPESGAYFMGVDCPSSLCVNCSTTSKPGYIWTPNYAACAWKQTVNVKAGINYRFSCWLEDLDVNTISSYPGATVSIIINNDTIFSDIISYANGYGNWQQIKSCWLSNATSATIQIIGMGTINSSGYDLGLDNISFTTTNLTIINTVNNVNCNDGNSGSATVNVTNGHPPYSYSWYPGGGTNATETGLSAGVYIVSIFDSSGCSANDTVTIIQPAALSLTTLIYNIQCNGGHDGSIFGFVSGGSPPYAYLWSNGKTSSSISNLSTGIYSVLVIDNNNCSAAITDTIPQPNPIALVDSIHNTTCYGSNSGYAITKVFGGTSPYTYLWSPGGCTNAVDSNLKANTYTVNITDNNGCNYITAITITQPAQLKDSIKGTAICLGDTTTLIDYSSGGMKPYSYLWNNGGTNSSLTIGPATNTKYRLTVIDSNGCIAKDSTLLKVNPLPVVILIFQSNDTVCSGAGTITLFMSPAGGTLSGPAVHGKFFYPDSAITGAFNVIYYTYTDTDGCSAGITDSIYVENCTGIEQVQNNPGQLIMFPNPNKGVFYMEYSGFSGKQSMEVYDILGREIYYSNLNGSNGKKIKMIDLGYQSNGLYLYRVTDESGNIRNEGKIIIQK